MRVSENLDKEIRRIAKNNDLQLTQAMDEIARVVRNKNGKKVKEIKF